MLVALLLVPLERAIAYTAAQCPSFDHTNKFGARLDQDGHAYCWAFAGASLLEEELCMQNEANCGANISPLDASRCNFTLGQIEEKGFPGSVLKCAVQGGGACHEALAPYDRMLRKVNCEAKRVPGNGVSVAEYCANDKILNIWWDIYRAREKARENVQKEPRCEPKENKAFEKLVSQAVKSIEALVPLSAAYGVDTRAALLETEGPYDFLFRLSITPTCEKERLKVSGAPNDPTQVIDQKLEDVRSPSRVSPYSQEEKQRKLEALSKLLIAHPRSLAVAVCLDRLGKQNGTLPKNCDVKHALVLNGMRWNANQGRCEIHLRNSWGEDAVLDTWHDADDILPAIFHVNQLKVSKKP